MEIVILVVVAVIVMWWLGFFRSGKKLATMANRATTDLELGQLKALKNKHKTEEVKELKDYADEFDAL